jgi:catechol 2,3-dioxygenase-like lactoylglutathione lyase family enzyme
MDVASLAKLLHETADHHDPYEKSAPPHDWWDWYAAYLNARENGATSDDASTAAALYMKQAKGITPAAGAADSTAKHVDVANLPAPKEGVVATLFITVRKVARSRDFYSKVLGGTVVLEENPCIVKLANSWILMNPGGPPTPDKPGITVADYEPGDKTSIFLNLRVADIDACYRQWSERGAEFVTPPIDRGAEIRCYMRDPDGYLIEVGQSTGLLTGHLAAKRPEDLPG